MFSGLASILPSWSGAKWSAIDSANTDLERGDESRPRMDDDGSSGIISFRVADSYPSSIAEVDNERTLPDPPQDEIDDDNDVSTSGCGVGPSSEESASAVVPVFLSTVGRSASAPPEIFVRPPPDSLQLQLQDQDHIHSSTSTSSSTSPNNSYTRFFHRTRAPKQTRSSRSLGPGGTQGGSSGLSPIYEPSNLDSRDSDSTQKEGVIAWPSTSQKKTAAPSVHSTTSTIQERVLCMQAAHPGFLKRPLNRSLSLTSSNSLHSEVSGAPQLPPLHFRPAFAGISVGIHASTPPVPSPGPQGSCMTSHPPTVVVPTRPSPSTTSPQRSQPNTPQSLASPRSHRFGYMDHSQKCSAIYEDSASEKSFVTAESGSTEPGPGVITKHDIPSTADLIIYPQDQETEGELGHAEGCVWDTQEQPSSSKVGGSVLGQPRQEPEMKRQRGRGFSESEDTFNVAPDLEKRPSTVPSTLQRPRGAGRASVMSIASTTVKNESLMGDDGVAEETATVVEGDQFIMERWMKTLFYSASGGKELLSTPKGGEEKQSPPSSACVLFWFGFIAPWCWLVGGWMPPSDSPLNENETKEKLKQKVSTDVDRGAVLQGQEGGGLRKWVLPDPSSSFGATARVPSTSSTTSLCSRDIEEAKTTTVDPWVRRCRIASIVGGTTLGLGLIVMVIVLAVVTK